MKQYTLSEDKLKELLYWSHSYGRSMQFNYSLFGPESDHAKPFSEDQAAKYCMANIEKLGLREHSSELESELLRNTQHTPGPWHLSNPKFVGKWAGFNTVQGKCYGIYATNEDLEAIALVPKDWMLAAKDQNNEANAKLIAAAPDLLEALEEIADGTYPCNKIEAFIFVDIAKDIAKAAIQKAIK